MQSPKSNVSDFLFFRLTTLIENLLISVENIQFIFITQDLVE